MCTFPACPVLACPPPSSPSPAPRPPRRPLLRTRCTLHTHAHLELSSLIFSSISASYVRPWSRSDHTHYRLRLSVASPRPGASTRFLSRSLFLPLNGLGKLTVLCASAAPSAADRPREPGLYAARIHSRKRARAWYRFESYRPELDV